MAQLWKIEEKITKCTGWTEDDIKTCDGYKKSRGQNFCIHRRVHREKDHELAQCLWLGKVEDE